MAKIVFDGLETKEERKCIRTLTQFGLRRKIRVCWLMKLKIERINVPLGTSDVICLNWDMTLSLSSDFSPCGLYSLTGSPLMVLPKPKRSTAGTVLFYLLSTPRESGSLSPNNVDQTWLDVCTPELIIMPEKIEYYDWSSGVTCPSLDQGMISALLNP